MPVFILIETRLDKKIGEIKAKEASLTPEQLAVSPLFFINSNSQNYRSLRVISL